MADVKFTLSTIDEFTNKLKKLEDGFKKVNDQADRLNSNKFDNIKNATSKQSQAISQVSANKKTELAEQYRIKAGEASIAKSNRAFFYQGFQNYKKAEDELLRQTRGSYEWLAGKKLDASMQIKNKKLSEFELSYQKALNERYGSAISQAEKDRQINEMFKQQDKINAQKKQTENEILKKEISQRSTALEISKKQNQEYIEAVSKRIKMEKTKQKEEEKTYLKQQKEDFKIKKQREAVNRKISNNLVQPINYVTDSFGNIKRVVKAGGVESIIDGGNTYNRGGQFVKEKPDRSNIIKNTAMAYGSYKAITTAEKGLNALVETPLQLEQVRASIGAMLFASGVPRENLKKATEEDVKFIYQMSQKYAMDPVDAAKNYSMALSVMASKTPGKRNLTRDELRSITEGFMNVSRVSGLDRESSSSVFLALSQMLGKNKIQAQEVNLQMSQRIPAIKNLLMKTIEETTNDPTYAKMYGRYRGKSIDELMEKGVISSDVLVNFQKVVNKTFEDMYAEKGKTLGAEVTRLSASFKELADVTTQDALPLLSGVVRVLNSGLQFITKSLSGNEGSYVAPWKDPNKTPTQAITANTYQATTDVGVPVASSYLLGKLLSTKAVTSIVPQARLAGLAFTNPFTLGALALGGAGYVGYNIYKDLNKEPSIMDQLQQIANPQVMPNNTQQVQQEQVKPEITLNLNIKQTEFGMIPIITTSDGRKLETGKNIIAGDRKYAY